jgi:hypothetical protein
MRRVCTNDLEVVVNKVPNAMSYLRRRPAGCTLSSHRLALVRTSPR